MAADLSRGIQKSGRRFSRPGPGGGTCKTCTPCRQKKIKCDSTRPYCAECTTGGFRCVYPQDARREPRPSKARIQSLEATAAAMLKHMKTSGIVPPHVQLGDILLPANEGENSDDITNTLSTKDSHDYNQLSQDASLGHLASTAAVASPLPTPSTSASGATEPSPNFTSHPPSVNVSFTEQLQELPVSGQVEIHNDRTPSLPMEKTSDTLDLESRTYQAMALEPSPSRMPVVPEYLATRAQSQVATLANTTAITGAEGSSGMSPCEARVAGAFHEHGCVSSVHGLASIMNPSSRAQHKDNISKMTWRGEGAVAASKARLISNAALQRQREPRLFRQPSNLVDLDGCDPELAKHLLDLHFNRQHYAYLISYRPAIMESLANGGGPWINKLLLNAIYYSSTLYSDRPYLRSNTDDPNSIGANFYRRFRQLLSDEIDKPSIPTAAALLLTSATLVSHGQSSAGWNLSGIAYRMIIDMGCHLMLGPDYQSISSNDHDQLLQRDLEQEMRKRLYWGAFVTDATQALYLGRPCMFAAGEARVPLRFLDTFEELEEWEPYIDPQSTGEPPPPYAPQPAHALSTFSCLARLFQISIRITELYGIQTIKCSSEYLQDKKISIEKELEHWNVTLPAHLRFDPNKPFTPPPHQITPHTTFHALSILLHRAFLKEGHLRRHCDEGGRARSEESCINSALAIEKLVHAYKQAFTLRRAPFLLSYAVYSAVIVILRQEQHERGQFTESISFFWKCLSELKHGCNVGLEKPLGILRDMVHEFHLNIQKVDIESDGIPGLPNVDEAIPPSRSQQPANRPAINAMLPGEETDYMGQIGQPNLAFDNSSPGFLVSLNQLENDISEDALYGLFAPSQIFL
ncbi:fungal-specific transcription factor domain-containing protein [Talaromyces proteolyticus]|uniref:Fungal-specific transcription factor domain-containing protein n=1 Tax=Talaromyces proteolyticus TaxID=1131652 RepID=A0AAD4KSL8_9EURO|nr:fungal-specific transcription factor domain-containing protein [Talaromyces proteolyticus]KAH8700167.1 fungal-specific transcription factor domain-containing protein [Talaromyces proteolyticus]